MKSMMKKTGFARMMSCAVMGALTVGMLVRAGTAKPAGDALVVESGGVQGLFVDEKDQGLKKALQMLDQRLAELPKEFGNNDIPPGAIEMVTDILLSPFTLQAGWIDGADPRMGPPFYAQLAVNGGGEQQTNELAGRFGALLAQMGAPVGAVDATTGLGKVMLDQHAWFYHGVKGKAGDS
ncbi:MAG TPA: hypothetical protein VG711_10405, partial [Phycisphaerales bacterium]|nr:hypothetical protein [Phycisphaerales bacterium]